MGNLLTTAQVRRRRLRAQRLDADRATMPIAQLLHDIGGLQAQELPASHLGVRARTSSHTDEAVRQAREVERSIVRTWTMRGTLHLLAAEDVRWQLALLGPGFIRKTERRYQQLGLDSHTRQAAAHHMQAILSSQGPLTRAELASALAARAIPVEGQAIHHLIRYAALSGLVCFGPERDGDLTCVLLDDWLPAAPPAPTEEAVLLAELARRYWQAYAPATVHDFASWAGITLGQARAGFEAVAADLIAVDTGSGEAWMLKSQWEQRGHKEADDDRTVRLLPYYDTYLLGYQRRDFMVASENAAQVHPGGGLIRAVMIVDGQAQAVWHIERKRDHALVIVQPFARLDPALMPALEAEVADMGRFLNQDMRLEIEV